jgi:hypothetical protein
MATLINDIKDGIAARIAIAAPTYSVLSYQVDIAQNKFKGNSKGFAIQPSYGSEVDGLIGAFTMDHQFSVTFTNSYNQGAKSQVGDTLKSSRITEITDDILDTYKDLCVNKGNIDTSILIINGLDIEQAEFIDEEKVITVKFNFNVKYKVNK